MKIHLRWICSFVLISSVGFAFTLKTYTPDWDSLDTRPIPSWYDEAKIGIFIHWGLYSVPSFGSEWLWWYWKGNQPDPQVVDYMTKNYPPDWTYADFGPYFHAEFYNPNQWADLFVASGAKYVVLTSKHHEGYAMWPSKYSFNWNSMDLGPKKDLIGELALALRNRTDIAFGLYHSLYEWFHPLYLQDKKNNFTTDHFTEMKALPELKELIERYQPDVIWSDGDWEATDTYWHSTEFLSWLYNESPVKDKIVVNDRWGPGAWCRHGDFYSCNDRFNPGYLLPHKWENCFTIDKNSWAYRRTSQLHDYLTIEEILHQIIVTVSTGGNALINIGPAGDGTIPTIFEERLRQMGAWLNIHGEAIYQSIPWNYQNDTIHPDVWYTSSKNKQSLYACLLVWPTNTTELVLGAPIPSSNTVVSLLGSSMDPLKWRQMNETTGMIIDLSTVNSFTLASHGAWVFKLQYLKNH